MFLYQAVLLYQNETSAFANLVMTVGVLVAAYNIRIQKRIHFVDLHNEFQNRIRSIQEKLPSDINTRAHRLTPEQQRIVRMYWYAVFDEWLTCKKTNRSRELNQIWDRFAWGAKSAIENLPIFASEFIVFRNTKPYLLGTHDEFFMEAEIFCRTKKSPIHAARNIGTCAKKLRFLRSAERIKYKKCVFLFGIPCSGKTSIINEMQASDWNAISIDSVITKFVAEPTKESFVELADEICFEIYRMAVKFDRSKNLVIELGCLLPKEKAELLADMLHLASFNICAYELKIEIDIAIQRAKNRNTLLDMSPIHGVLPIDDPDKLSQFSAHLNANRIKICQVVDASDMSVAMLAKKVSCE